MRLFFDTNIMIAAGWPRISVKLENILKVAHKLDVIVELPQAVQIELKRNFRERMRKNLSVVSPLLQEFNWVQGRPKDAVDLATEEELCLCYEKTVQKLLDDWRFNTTRMPAIDASTLFSQANERELTFGDEGRNFQDTIIFHSMIDCLAALPGESGILIATDGIFKKREEALKKYAADLNVQFQTMMIETVTEYLEKQLGDSAQSRLIRHKALATKAVSDYLPTLTDLINERPSPNHPHSRFSESNYALTQVIDVDVAVVDEEPEVGSSVRFSAIVRGTVDVSEHVMDLGRRRQIEIGSTENNITEIGFTGTAIYTGGSYSIDVIAAITFGGAGNVGTVGHAKIHDWK